MKKPISKFAGLFIFEVEYSVISLADRYPRGPLIILLEKRDFEAARLKAEKAIKAMLKAGELDSESNPLIVTVKSTGTVDA